MNIKLKGDQSAEEDDQFERDARVNVKQSQKKIPEDELEILLVANTLQLFLAGYETTSTILSVIIYFLAKNPDVQELAYQEIKDIIDENGSLEQLDYHTVKDRLQYLEKLIFEATRHYPLTVVERECVKDYKINGMEFVIPKGMLVQIPSLAFMKDEANFPDPEKFDPENFSPEQKAVRSPYAYLAFGQGPRNCIGMRFALLQMKIALTHVLYNYKVIPCAKTVEKLVPDPLSRTGQPIGGVWVKLEKRYN